MNSNLRSCLAELIGTFAVVFLGAGAVCSSYSSIPPLPDATGIALAQGLVYAVAIAATASVSGGYLNPAITLVLYLLRRIDTPRFFWLVMGQLLGAALAGALLRFTFAQEDVLRMAELGTPHLRGYDLIHTGALFNGAALVCVLTFLLTFVVFATDIEPRGTPRLYGFGAGAALAAIVRMSFAVTGGGVNPAATFGTYIWELPLRTTSNWREHVFVYWVAPLVGAVLAGWVYVYVILAADERAKKA